MQTTDTMPRPKRSDKDNEKVSSAEKGTKPGEARKTYILPVELIEKAAEIAYIDRKYEKEIIGEALHKYIVAYEKKNGEIKIRKK
jgi:hypothetical protein